MARGTHKAVLWPDTEDEGTFGSEGSRVRLSPSEIGNIGGDVFPCPYIFIGDQGEGGGGLARLGNLPVPGVSDVILVVGVEGDVEGGERGGAARVTEYSQSNGGMLIV